MAPLLNKQDNRQAEEFQLVPETTIYSEQESSLTKRVNKYKRRNKELVNEDKELVNEDEEQRAALLALQQDFVMVNLELAQAKSNNDANDVNMDEAIASKDFANITYRQGTR